MFVSLMRIDFSRTGRGGQREIAREVYPHNKLEASVYDILPPTTAVIGYALTSLCVQMAVSFNNKLE